MGTTPERQSRQYLCPTIQQSVRLTLLVIRLPNNQGGGGFADEVSRVEDCTALNDSCPLPTQRDGTGRAVSYTFQDCPYSHLLSQRQ